jgi:hypothetical protein
MKLVKKLVLVYFITSGLISVAQESRFIVSVIDELTVQWDESAIKLRTYQDIQNFCARGLYREQTFALLDTIHHWDTTLYFVVQSKYSDNEDEEAKATLRDIETLETDYTTEKFKHFITDECNSTKMIEGDFYSETPKAYEKGVRKFEKELNKYITSITRRIDIIDEHIHHLKLE